MKITRRFFVVASSMAAFIVSACANFAKIVSQVSQDVSSIASGLLKVLPQAGQIVGITPDKVAIIGEAVSSLQNLAAKLASATSNAEAQPIVKQVEAAINSIIDALAGIPFIPPPFSTALQAAVVLVPVIETAAGLLVPQQMKLRAAAVSMSPNQARAFLDSLK